MSVQPREEGRTDQTPRISSSCIFTAEFTGRSNWLWISASMEEILGYRPSELIGRSPFDLVHPEERSALEESRYQAMVYDKIAVLIYTRWRHKSGHYVLCGCGMNVVYDRFVGTISIAVDSPKARIRAATAQEVQEISPESRGSFRKPKWYSNSPPRRTSDMFLLPADRVRLRTPIEDLAPPSKRTFLLLDRFSRSTTILSTSNNIIIRRPERFRGQSIYSIIASSDREMVRREIETAKSWAASGDHGVDQSSFVYIAFRLEEPDEPSIMVQGIIAAYSDGITCILRHRAL